MDAPGDRRSRLWKRSRGRKEQSGKGPEDRPFEMFWEGASPAWICNTHNPGREKEAERLDVDQGDDGGAGGRVRVEVDISEGWDTGPMDCVFGCNEHRALKQLGDKARL